MELSKKEYELLELLFRNKHQVLTREIILKEFGDLKWI